LIIIAFWYKKINNVKILSYNLTLKFYKI
jgi:hypothetical protein